MIIRSRKNYKKGIYIHRSKLKSFKSKKSSHIKKAKRIYRIDKIVPSKELSNKTKCSLESLKEIVRKGEGAYYSSGSRPNQTAQSWAYARLASAITGGKAFYVDRSILEKGCKRSSKVFKMTT